MGHPPRLTVAALACLFLLVAVAEAASKCTVGCHGMHPSKAYQEGHTYVYKLEGLSVTSVTDAQEDASLKLAATVEMSVKPDCVHQLRLKNVQINGAPPSTPDVEQYAVQFNYHDGHIDTELCAEPGDSQASLNIKRAVVSMFQSAVMQESGSTVHGETDIMGDCPTEFNFHKEGDILTVHKTRNLNQCAFREDVKHGLISGSVDTAAGVKASPLLGSQQEVEQRFKQGVLNKAVSKEEYKLKPFSNGNAGAKTVVETRLTLKSEKPEGSAPAPVSQPKSLIFEAPHPVLKSSPEAITKALKEATAEISNGVQPKAASKLSELAKVLRVSSKDDIMSVYKKVQSGADSEKNQIILLDAMSRAGSGEAAEVGVELLKNKQLSDRQALMFYASLLGIRHVNLGSVTNIASLLDQPDLPRMGYLGVGHAIGKYCQDHPCENVPEVKEAIHKIREKVGNGKAKTREQENLIVAALKALGNSQFLDDATLQKLANIGADKNVKNRVRVAAIEALPNRCSMKWKNILLKVLADREEDSEIRIKAYLSLVACPCPHVAEQLKEILDKETVNQVGSFIQSHLRNLRASTDPSKSNAKNLLGLIKSQKKFPEDIRKYSFNNELSYKVGAFGLGSSLENNVIYSQNSFVPRSTDLNMTMELFGRNFNFLELNARVENLDRVIEHYFGPKGKVWETDLDELKSSGSEAASHIGKYIKERYEKAIRGKREVKQGDLNRFAKNVHLRDNEVDEDLDLDLSVKLFGVELAYLSYQGNPGKLNAKAIIDKVFDNLEKGFSLTKSFNLGIQNNFQFLDAEIVYPTGLGSSLNLGLTGISALFLKTNGKIDIPAILKDPKNANLRFALEPSISVEIEGSMIVQAPGCESGMKIVNTLHTSTSTDISVSVLDGKGLDVNIGLPKKQQVLINLSSSVLLGSGPKGHAYSPAKFDNNKEYSDCFDQFSKILGLMVCGKISYPYEDISAIKQKPLFPLSGPGTFSVMLENMDVTSYRFKVYLNSEDPKKKSFELLFDTPNSKTNRRVAMSVEAGLEPNKYVKVALDSPVKKASIEGTIKNTPQERTLTVVILHDTIEYYGRLGIVASGSKYKPILEYRVPEHIEKLANAKTGMQPGQQYSAQGEVDVSDYQGGQKYTLEKVSLLVGDQKLVTVDGTILWTPLAVSVDTNLNYMDKNLAFKLDGKKVADNNYMLAVSALPSVDPNVGFSLNWEFKRGQNDMEHKLVFVHGPDQNTEVNRLSLNQKAVYKLDPKDLLLSTSNELKYPALNLKMKLDGKLSKKSLSADLEMKYSTFNLGTELSVKRDMEKPGDYAVELEAELMDNSLELKSRRTVVDSHKSKFANSLVLKLGGRYDADATVVYDVRKNNVNIQFDGDVNLNGTKIKVDTGLEANLNLINSKVYVKVDGVKYVEFALNAKRTPNPSGTLTLLLKNYLTAHGQYAYQNQKGNADLNIDIPKINRKIKATGSLAITGTMHVGKAELLYDAEKDPNKRIKLSTETDITQEVVDTKNVLEILTHKFEVNAKRKLQGTLNDGQLTLDMDITLPNGRYLVGKGKRTSTKKDNKYDIQLESELNDHEQKGGPSRKLAYVAEVKDFDTQAMTFQGMAQLKYVNADGKDTHVSWKAKNLIEPDKKKLRELNIELDGHIVPKPIQLHLSNNKGETDSVSKLKTTVGDDFSLMSSVILEAGNEVDKPYKVNSVLDMKLPSEKLKNLKLESSSSGLRSERDNLLEISDKVKLTYNNDKNVEMDTYLKLVGVLGEDLPSTGVGKLNLNILNLPPVKLAGNYEYNGTPEKKTAKLDLSGAYGDKEVSLQADNEYLPKLATVNVKGKGNLNLEKLKNVDLQLVYKRFKDENKWTVDSDVTADGNKYTFNSEIQHQQTNNLFRVETSSPMGKTTILSKLQKLGDKEFKGEWMVNTPKGFVTSDVHIDLESIDNFVIMANFDSDKIKHRKIHAEIANKPTPKVGKRLIVTVTSDGQTLVTGSTSYDKRDEDGKIIVEGNGNLKIGDNSRSSSFKYTRCQLTKEKDGESGVTMLLNANFGVSAIVSKLKVSNKELHVFNSFCDQNKPCAQVNLQSIVNVGEKSYNNQLTLEVNLKKFNVPVEFGLKTGTQFEAFALNHLTNLYLHSTKDKSEYTFKLYGHPKDAGVSFVLPSREIAAIVTLDIPSNKVSGFYKADLSVYLDKKNKPSDKTSLSASANVDLDGKVNVNGETRFTYPKQTKDMVVKGKLYYAGANTVDANLDLDVFNKKTQKISISAKLKRDPIPEGNNVTLVGKVESNGQQLKLDLKSYLTLATNQMKIGSFFTYNDVKQNPKTMGVLLSADYNNALLLITLPDKELYKDSWKMNIAKNEQKIDRELSVLGETPKIMNFQANDWNRFQLQAYSSDTPDNKLVVKGQVVLGQLAEINADTFKSGDQKNLFKVLVHLDENHFLKPSFEYHKENVAQVLNIAKQRHLDLMQKAKDLNNYVVEQVKAETTDLVDHLRKAQPNLKPLVEYYQNELKKITSEVSSDETIKEIHNTLNQYFGTIAAAITETMKQVVQGLQKLQLHLNEIITDVRDAIKSMYPQLKESYDKIFNHILVISEALAKLINTYLEAALDVINQHQKEIQDVMDFVSDMTKDFAKIITKGLEQIKQNVDEFVTMLMNQLKALPIYEILKEKLQDLKNIQIPDMILNPIEELCKIVKASLVMDELRDLVDVTCQYIIKHIKREKVDEAAELKQIYKHVLNAGRSILTWLQKQTTIDNVLALLPLQTPLDLNILSKIPGISTLKLSILNLMQNGELPSALALYHAYRPTLHLSDIIPPFSKSGVVTDGGHFFTFDGRHLTLPGTCTYILAQDMQDGNFSIVGNFNNGGLISITVTEPKESITLKNNGNILVNNKPADFPASTKNLHAYLVKPFTNVKSDYGVRVTCSNQAPMICAVHVSGFYLGKLRGILGDGNNEPYDDYTLPSGKITESGTEFGNAYKLKGDCADASAVDHKDHAPICTEYFTSSTSPLSSCFNYVNPAQYRDACDHAVAAKTLDGSCLIATAYHYACYSQRVMTTRIPASCTNCKVGGNEVSIGDTFSVKIPKKEADIVFVVEQQTPNEKVFKEMITPLMSELREELKQHGVTDVHIGLIGFSEAMKWPQHYTLNGQPNIEGEVKNMKFDEKKPSITLQEAKEGNTEKKLDYLHQRLNVELSTFKLTDAYEEAIRYSFRPAAAKAVVGVITNPCEKSPFTLSLQQIRLLIGQKTYRDLGLTYHHVAFLNQLLVSGKPHKNIVGYDKDSVYTFADSKKKPLTGSSDMKSNLATTTSDVCADFAVSSGGAAFSSDNFLDAKPNQKKQFVQVAAKRIVDGLVNLELEKDCLCDYQYGMIGQSRCKIVGRKNNSKSTKA